MNARSTKSEKIRLLSPSSYPYASSGHELDDRVLGTSRRKTKCKMMDENGEVTRNMAVEYYIINGHVRLDGGYTIS